MMRVADLKKILESLPDDAAIEIYNAAFVDIGSMGWITGHSYCDLTDLKDYQGFDYPGILYLDFNTRSSEE